MKLKEKTFLLTCLQPALVATEQTLSQVLKEARFWDQHASKLLNERQRLMLNKLWADFEGKLTSSKWAKMTKCSQDTANRDIQYLIEQEIIVKDTGGGRSTSYLLKDSFII